MAATASLDDGGQFQSFISEEGGTDVDWEFDKFDDGSHKLVGKITLEKYGGFLREYSAQLKSIVEAVDETMGGDAWDAAADPIQLQCAPVEASTLRDMLQSNGETLNRVILVLATLIKEIAFLKSEAESKFYDALLFYGEGIPVASSTAASGVDNQMAIAKLLPLLQDLSAFVARCHEVAKNVVCQFACLHKPQPKGGGGQQHVLDTSHVHFEPVMEALGELLTILITLDEIVDAQVSLREHWTLFKRMIKSVSMDAKKFDASDEDLKHFEKVLMMLEGRLLDGVIFQNCVEQGFDDALELPLNKNSVVADVLLQGIKRAMTRFETSLPSSSSSSSSQSSASGKVFVGICGLFVLHFQLFRNLDKKFFKQLWDVHKRMPGATVWGNVFFLPNEFLLTKLPQFQIVIDKKTKGQLVASRDAFVKERNANSPKETQALHFQTSSWMIHMERHLASSTDLKTDTPLVDQLEERCNLLVSGLAHAQSLSNWIATTLNLCAVLSKPMAKSAVLSLCRSIELLKAIHFIFHRHSLNISKSVNHVVLHLTLKAAAILEKCHLRAKAEKRSTRRHEEILAAFQILESSIKEGVKGTPDRRAVVNLALAIVRNTKHVKDDEMNALTAALKQISVVSTIFAHARRACDCAFFYWHRAVIPVYLVDVLKSGSEGNGSADAYRMRYFFAALKDCLEPMAKVKHLEDHKMMRTAFETEVKEMVKENLLDPICQHVETDLRLCIHSHLQLDDRNPFRVGLSDLAPFIQMKPIKFNDSSIDVKAYVEQYLDTTFYNLTTVALHDWKTYGDMKHLALNKYGLELIDADLPSQTLEQGLDVLEIMRNIHVFVSKYLYNLNNQIFVEKSSNNKYLNTINIRHVANSIRTHGIGIMNTTVNFTFQFLGKKFKIFSEFLFDEHIKSKLMKDIRFFRDNHAKSDQKYPFDRADRFNRAIRKLGVMEDGSSYLDKFREVVTEIGNAMGYIRMIRSGGLHCVANAIQFVPSDADGGREDNEGDEIGYFERLVSSISLSTETLKAASNLDAVVDNLVRNFAEGTEYFKMLVNVFQASMKNHAHLRNFWIIVPPLMMNFIEHILAAKEKLTKKNKVGAAFTDDGFVMGVAFILKLLDQYLDFDSLHWFQSIGDYYETEKKKVADQKSKLASAGKTDERLQQSMNLTVKRLETYRREFQLLEYSLSSARIFFRADMTAAEENEEKRVEPVDETKPGASES